MFWYLVISILMIYPLSIVIIGKNKAIDTQKLALLISCMILFFFMAMRAPTVGVDTKFYCYVFEQLSKAPITKVFSMETYATQAGNWSLDFEWGYRLYNKIWGILGSSWQIITIGNSLTIFLLLYRLIKKESKNYFLSIWLYLTLGIYQTEMNVARNAIAIMICYYAMQYIEKRDWKRYMGLICVAACIHKSVLIFIPLYFLFKRPFISNKKMYGLWIISVAGGVFALRYTSLIQALFSGASGSYLTAGNEKQESLLVGILYLCMIVIVAVVMKREERSTMFQRCPIGAWMFTLNMCCFGMNIGFKMAARVAALFGTYMIIFLPDLIDTIPDCNRRAWATMLVMSGSMVQYILRMVINNIGGTLPYEFFM